MSNSGNVFWEFHLTKTICTDDARTGDAITDLELEIEKNGIRNPSTKIIVSLIYRKLDEERWDYIYVGGQFLSGDRSPQRAHLFQFESRKDGEVSIQQLDGLDIDRFALDRFLPEVFPAQGFHNTEFEQFFFPPIILSEDKSWTWSKSSDWYITVKALGRRIVNSLVARAYDMEDGSLYLVPGEGRTGFDGWEFLTRFIDNGQSVFAFQRGDRWVVEHNGTKWDLTGFSREMLTPDGATFPRYQP